MDVYEPIYFSVIVLIGAVAFIANKICKDTDEYDIKFADIVQKMNDTEISSYENEKHQCEKIIINKLYSSSIDSLKIERYNMHTICKYYDVKMNIRYDKYYAFDIGDGRENLHIHLMDYYSKHKAHFLTSLFNKYIIDIKLFIDLYHIDIDLSQRIYTITHNRFTVRSSDYIHKLPNIPYDDTVIDNENVFIKLISKIVEDKNTEYFFIQKHIGRCELLFTNGIQDISLDTFDKESCVSTRYFYA
jgi:hypothetical protein